MHTHWTHFLQLAVLLTHLIDHIKSQIEEKKKKINVDYTDILKQ